MQTLLNIVNSEAFWAVITVLIGYVANTFVSRKWIADLPPTSPILRGLRVLHGFLDKIDPKVLVLALALPLLNGCAALLGTAVVAGQAACTSGLLTSPAIRDEAEARGIPLAELVDLFCAAVDVAAVFDAEPRSGVARPALSPTDQAVALLRAKGELP